MSAQILAALVGSAPGWAAVGLALYAQRRSIGKALDRQTDDIKAHITSTAPGTAGPPTDQQRKAA